MKVHISTGDPKNPCLKENQKHHFKNIRLIYMGL